MNNLVTKDEYSSFSRSVTTLCSEFVHDIETKIDKELIDEEINRVHGFVNVSLLGKVARNFILNNKDKEEFSYFASYVFDKALAFAHENHDEIQENLNELRKYYL